MVQASPALPAACAAFLLTWAAGLPTLAPGFPHGDSGETAAVALHLGIAHPPGYPLPTLLGRIFVWLFASGCVAWRVGLLALAGAAAAAGLLTGTLKARDPKLGAPTAALLGLLGGLALEVWNQMTLPKGSVYTVSIALLGAMAFCLARLNVLPGRMLFLFGTALGLACGGHYMIVMPCLVFVPFLLFFRLRRRPGGMRALSLCACGAALGVSLYLYIPLRAGSAHPALRWAEPDRLERFRWLVLRRQYFSIEKQERGDSGLMLLNRFGGRFYKGFGVMGLLAVALGAALAWTRREWWLMALGGGAVLEIAAAAFYPKLAADALWVADPFFSSGWYLAALLIAGGIAAYAGAGRLWLRASVLLAAGFLIVRAATAGWTHVSKRWNYYAWDQQANIAATLPRDSLLFCEGDAYIAPLIYGLWVEGQMPSLRMIIPIFLHFDWGLSQIGELYPEIKLKGGSPWGHVWEMSRDIMAANPGLNWHYTLTTSAGWPFKEYAHPKGLVFGLAEKKPEGADFAVDRAMFRYRLRDTMNAYRIERDPFKRVLLENYVKAHFLRGALYAARKDRGRALEHFRRGRRLGSPECGLNEGLIHFSAGRLEAAGKSWRQAALAAPERPEAHANLGLLALARKRPGEAIAHCEKAIAADPGFPKSYEILANAWFMKGEGAQALAAVDRGIASSPADARLKALREIIVNKVQESYSRPPVIQ